MSTGDRIRWVWAIVALVILGRASVVEGQGVVLPGAGPINRSMAGASTALPVDFGSSYWNPATISGLGRQEFLVGAELIIPSTHFQSTLPAGSIDGVLPASTQTGRSRSDGGVISSPATGTSFRLTDDSPWTFGLGVFGLVGGGLNLPGSASMPTTTPRQPPRTFGVGPNYSAFSVLAIEPMASYQATEKLAIAAGPVVTTSSISFSPAFFAAVAGDKFGPSSFPSGTNGRPFWGGGFQLGMLYNLNPDWNLGFSYKSPVWLERWGYNATNPDGSPRYISLQGGVPAIYSWGVAYKGLPKTLLDVDLRYFDYPNTPLFGTSLKNHGFGWRGVFAMAAGGAYKVSDRMTLRGGYLYNTQVDPTIGTLGDVQAPAITQHTLSLGATVQLTDDVSASAAWVHGFRNSVGGKIFEVPGSINRLDEQYDSLIIGLNIQFGRMRKPATEVSTAPAPTPDSPSNPAG